MKKYRIKKKLKFKKRKIRLKMVGGENFDGI